MHRQEDQLRHRISLHHLAVLGAMGFVACAEDSTGPSPTDDLAQAVSQAVASGHWIRRADMWSVERWDLALAAVPNAAGESIVYAIGGRSATGAPLGKVMAYNVATNTWTLKRSLPVPLQAPNQAAVIKNKIYVSGGCQTVSCSYDPPSSRLYVYDPATDTWTRKQDMPGVRDVSGELLFSGTSGVSGVIAGQLYTLSQCYYGDSPQFYECRPSLFFRYNPASDRWTALPRPSATYTAGGVIEGKFYVVGGVRDPYSGQLTMRTEVYDPATNRWTPKAPPPEGLGSLGASTVLEGELYVIGGRLVHPPDGPIDTLRTVRAYNPGTNAWTTKAPLPNPGWRFAATKVFLDGEARIEIVGGSRPGNNVQYVP